MYTNVHQPKYDNHTEYAIFHQNLHEGENVFAGSNNKFANPESLKIELYLPIWALQNWSWMCVGKHVHDHTSVTTAHSKTSADSSIILLKSQQQMDHSRLSYYTGAMSDEGFVMSDYVKQSLQIPKN